VPWMQVLMFTRKMFKNNKIFIHEYF